MPCAEKSFKINCLTTTRSRNNHRTNESIDRLKQLWRMLNCNTFTSKYRPTSSALKIDLTLRLDKDIGLLETIGQKSN